MTYLQQLTAYPSLLVGPVLVAALISGAISAFVAWKTSAAASADVDRKILAERNATDIKLAHDSAESISERAWADYELRRDVYLEFAGRASFLFQELPDHPNGTAEYLKERSEFQHTLRKLRLIGSDEVVSALNQLTSSIKANKNSDIMGRYFAVLMNTIRKDIRTLNETPAVGTSLDESAFPIES